MPEHPKIVFNPSKPKHKLRKKIAKKLFEYFMMKLNEQLVLGLVHSGFEPVAEIHNITLKQTGKPNWRLYINKLKISIINWLLMILGGD